MPFYPSKLREAIRARGLTSAQAAKLASMSENRLRQALDANRIPTAKQVERLTDTLAIPIYAFFYKNFRMPDEEIVDFRTQNPAPLKSGANSKKINYFKNLRDFLSILSERMDEDVADPIISISPDESPEQIASAVSQQLRLPEIRRNSRDKRDFLKQFRVALGRTGVVVIQDHNLSLDIDGFALQDPAERTHTIVINSRSRNQGARSFTLAHELCHVISRRSAISDNYGSDNNVETFCNEFSAALLLPRSEFFSYCERNRLGFEEYPQAVNSATQLSNYFFTSISACLIRAFTLNISDVNHYNRFARNAFSSTHLDTEKPKQGGGPEEGPAPGVIDRAFLGDRAVALIAKALEREKTSALEIFEKTGLSRRRINGLQSIARSEGIE